LIKDGLTDSAAIKVRLQVEQLIPARKEAAGPTLSSLAPALRLQKLPPLVRQLLPKLSAEQSRIWPRKACGNCTGPDKTPQERSTEWSTSVTL